VSTKAAAELFPGGGRVSDRKGLHISKPYSEIEFTCDVETSSFVPGSETEYLRIRGTRERGDSPFIPDPWPNPATTSFFSGGTAGGATGGVGPYLSWVLAPATCLGLLPAFIAVSTPADFDRVKRARFVTDIANKAAVRADCAGDQPLTAPAGLPAAPVAHPVTKGSVCGITGLPFPGPDGDIAKARETVQDRTAPTWACEVKDRAVFAVTQDPQFLAAITGSQGYASEQPGVAGLRMSGFDGRHVVADCSGTPTYFSLELRPVYATALGSPGTPTAKELFAGFVETAGKSFGCATTSP
jgi:hypothetical protein